MSWTRARTLRPLRDFAGRRLHAVIDRRIAEKAAALEERAVQRALERVRWDALREPQVFGPRDRLTIAPSATVNDALFNTVSGTIAVEEHAFFGHGVAILTGTHDIEVLGARRKDAIPSHGRDVTIGPGAWVSSRAMVLGPCRIGRDAVVAAGAVVTGDVPDATVVAGVPARPVRDLAGGGIPAAVDVDTDVGRLYLHAGDEVITPEIRRRGRMEDADVRALRAAAAPGSTVVDVGANIGYVTLAAADAVGPQGRVVAVEPHPANVQLLRANVARNGAGNVQVVAAAAMEAAGPVELSECRSNTGDHRVGVRLPGRPALTVPAVRLDDVVGDGDVRVIKLDTQATEHHAVAGAAELVRRCRPLLLAEFWPQGLRERGEDPAEVLAFYRRLGYERRVLEDPELDGLDDAELIARVHARPAPFGGFVTLELRPAGA